MDKENIIDIPDWLTNSIHNFLCPHCNTTMQASQVSGVGIKRSSKYKNRSVFFFAYDCKKCNKDVFVEMDFMNVEDFVMGMIDEYSNRPEKGKKKKKKQITENKSKISTDEVKDLSSILEKCTYWDDFLLNIGLTQDEVDKNKEIGKEEYSQRMREKRETGEK